METTEKPASDTDSGTQSADDVPLSGSSGTHPHPIASLQSELHRIEHRFEKRIRRYSAAEITILGFISVILLGSVVLYFIENTYGPALSYLDALFTSTSAVCVTGLTSVDFSRFSFPGQVATMLLIQIGGFGVITAFRLLWLGRVGDLSPGSTQTLGSVMDVDGGHQTVFQVLASTAKITIAIELAGFLLMYGHMHDRVADSPGWWSLFHTISAFNNAGFGLHADSLIQYRSDLGLNLIVAGLFIVGGIGYPVLLGIERIALVLLHRLLSLAEVLIEMIAIRKPERLTLVEPFYTFVDRLLFRAKKIQQELAGVASPLQMKVVIYGTLVLVLAGTLITLAFEWNDERTLGLLSGPEKLLAAFFQSVTTRTAGFNTLDIGSLQIRTLLFYVGLMFIGAAPQGSAGGIKIPTFVTMLGYIRASFRGRNRVYIFDYIVSKISVGNAVKLYVMSSTFVLTAILIMASIESKFTLTQMAFEVVSAFGTVGLSTGITFFLAPASKVLLIVTMFSGRVGLLTIGSAIIKPSSQLVAAAPTPDDGMKLQVG